MVFRERGSYYFTDTFPDGQKTKRRNEAKLSAFTVSEGKTIQELTNDDKADTVEGKYIGDKDELYVKMPRKVIIEPAMVLAFMFVACWYQITAQYHYYTIGERHNLTAIMENESRRRNQTRPGDGDDGDRCGSTSDNKNSTAYQLQQQTQAEAARFNLYMELISDVPALVILLFFGQLMDQVGRRPALIISVCGMVLRVVMYILQQLIGFPLEVLLITGIIDATTGGFGTFITASYAYLADTIPPKNRAKRMTIAQVAYNIAMALTNFGMGFLIQTLGFFWPTVVVCCGHILNLFYIVFFVPETRPHTATWKSISPKYILDSFRVIIKKRPQNGRKLLHIFIAAWVMLGFAWSDSGVYTLYKLNSPFCWTPSMLGMYSAVSLLLHSSAQLCATLFLYKRFNHSWIIVFSLLSSIGYNITEAVASKDWILWIAPVVGIFSRVSNPLLRSILSALVLPSEQGSLFSCLMALDKVTAIAGSAMYSNIYAATLYFFKGTVFIVMAAFVAIAIVIIVFFISMQRREETRNKPTRMSGTGSAEEKNERF